MVQTHYTTVEEFLRFIDLPENADRLFEYIGGEIVEVPSNPFVSYIAMRIARRLAAWVEDRDLGFVTGEAGGYVVAGERYAPDIACLAKEKGPLAPKGYHPAAPDLAVEVFSPTDNPDDLRIKVVNYLRAGTVVWVVNPGKQYVEAYTPDRAPQRISIDGTLDGGDMLPGFSLAVKAIFPG